MSLYNLLHGRNPNAALLLAVLNLDGEDGKWPTGRFRDIYPNEDGSKIILYTRNGGGNRDCWHEGNPEFGSQGCKHHVIVEEVDEMKEIREGPFVRCERAGNRVNENRYVCESPNSAECVCPGCVIEHRIKAHPNYVGDHDDDFDCTYAYVEFSVPSEYADIVRGLSTGEAPQTIHEKFLATIAEMKSMSKEQVMADPRFGEVAKVLDAVISNIAEPK